ncbi:MAG: type II secretion system F family protein [Coriobacteriales bacterium]|nr:type II secretion system F family protein [Coriobacteriales bacterium]
MWSQKLVELGAPLPIVGPLIRRGQNQHLLISCQADLPRMLEILAMAMRAGLSFDAAFGLYVSRFDNPLSRVCAERFDVWNKGLISREDGLRKLASTLDIPLLSRFVSTTIRALHYGAPLAPLLEDCATEARRIYRDSQREKVAKAPVKMLIPTGTLILPAMLMLVIGPIILNVTERMV